MKLDSYINGARYGAEAHDLELEAMRDPLLGDALDGFDAVPGDHAATLERLAGRIGRSAAGGRAAARSQASRLRERRVRGWSVAAAVVFLAGVVGGGAWLLHDGIPSGSSNLAGRTDVGNGYVSDLVEEVLPPVTVMEEEVGRCDSVRLQSFEETALPEVVRVPDNPAGATGFSDVRFDGVEVAAVSKEQVFQTVEISGVAQPETLPAAPIPVTVAGRRTLEGRVVDAGTGEALAGVMIRNDADKTGTITDADGRFLLPLESESAKIVADYLGYESVDVAADSVGGVVLVAMNEDSWSLEDVVVVGYGAQRKSVAMGSVSTQKESRRAEKNAASEPVADTTQTVEFRRFVAARNAVRSAVSGPVRLSFKVSSKGRPRDIKIVETPTPEIAGWAVELLRNGPDWPAEPSRKIITIEL